MYIKYKRSIHIEIGSVAGSFAIATWKEYSVLNNALETERPIIAAMAELTEPTDTIWDVGANIGTYTILLGSKLSTGEVVAVEPYPPNAARLREHIAANAIPATVEEIALSDEGKTAELAILYSEQPGAEQHSYVSEYIDQSQQITTCEVPLTPGDDLVADGVPSPDIMKIDVEGAGVHVLRGFENTLRSGHCRALFIEPHDNRNTISEILNEYNYSIEFMDFKGYRKNEDSFIVAHSK
jgi:FkbM family methyltransferase